MLEQYDENCDGKISMSEVSNDKLKSGPNEDEI